MTNHLKAILAVVGTWVAIIAITYLASNWPMIFMCLILVGVVGMLSALIYAFARLVIDDNDYPY